jgi:hypothetical protein
MEHNGNWAGAGANAFGNLKGMAAVRKLMELSLQMGAAKVGTARKEIVAGAALPLGA